MRHARVCAAIFGPTAWGQADQVLAYIEKARDSRLDEKRALLQLALEQFRLFQQLAPQDPRAPAAAHNIEALEPQVK